MIAIQHVEAAAPAAPTAQPQAAAPRNEAVSVRAIRKECEPGPDGEVIVCAPTDPEQFRLRPLPPPPRSDGLLSRPLRVRIAPGVSLGFQNGGGFGVRAEFGPGKKDEIDQ